MSQIDHCNWIQLSYRYCLFPIQQGFLREESHIETTMSFMTIKEGGGGGLLLMTLNDNWTGLSTEIEQNNKDISL